MLWKIGKYRIGVGVTGKQTLAEGDFGEDGLFVTNGRHFNRFGIAFSFGWDIKQDIDETKSGVSNAT